MVISSALIGLPSENLFSFYAFCNLDHLFYWSPTFFYARRKISWGHYSCRLVLPSVGPSVNTSHMCPAHNLVIWSQISKLFYRNDHHVDHVSRTTFGSLPSRSLRDIAAKSCPNFLTLLFEGIFSKIFHRNNHHIKTTCRAKIWVGTLKVKVTAWPCSKNVSGQ